MADGCGGYLDCGSCTAPETCGGGNLAGQCGCTPTTCAEATAECGSIPDGCGGTLDCGATCSGSASCGGNGVANECGPRTCVDGWCWRNPVTTGTTLYAVAGSAPDNVWATDAIGQALHFDGKSWNVQAMPGAPRLVDLWAAGPSAVFGIGVDGSSGSPVVYHWNGAAWSSMQNPATQTLTGISGVSGTDVWASGKGGLYHFDGSNWSASLTGVAFNDVWVASTNDGWAVGDNGVLAHFDGSAWKSVLAGITTNLVRVDGTGPADVWALGAAGTYHFDGSSWNEVKSGAGSVAYRNRGCRGCAG